VNCWDTFTFNNSTCTWDNDGTAQPAAPKKAKTVGILLLSTPLLVLGIMMEHKPAAPEKQTVGILLTPLLVLGIMMVQLNLQHQKK
jgi:hypothetical protein